MEAALDGESLMKQFGKMVLTLLGFICLALPACQAKIGDSCDNNVDCSPDGDRICDLSQPGGYCTIPDCAPDTCPGEAVCVQFWDGPHTRSWCMKECGSDGGCRGKYYCAAGFSEVAEIIDSNPGDSGFCIERPGEEQDAGEEEDVPAEDTVEVEEEDVAEVEEEDTAEVQDEEVDDAAQEDVTGGE